LYECFGWQPPVWTHIPLLLNPDRSKMSKRKNPTSVFYYRDAGYLPEALLNYLALIGYSRPNAKDEMFPVEDMVADFDIKNVSLGGSIFDMQKLTWLNGRYIRERLTPATLYERLKAWHVNDEYFLKTMDMMHARMETLGDFMDKCKFFWMREVAPKAEDLIPKGREAADAAAALQCLLWEFEEKDDWTPAGVERAVSEVVGFFEWKIRDLTGPLFPAIMGEKVGPPLYDSMSVLGKDMCRVRIAAAINLLGAAGKKKLSDLEKRYKGRERKTAPNG